MKKIIAILGAALLLTGCSSNPQNEFSQKDTSSKIFNVSTSYFESYTDEETDSTYIVKGRVDQENDGNAVAVRVHAKENKTIGLKGTLTKISGSDTELVYVSPDGENIFQKATVKLFLWGSMRFTTLRSNLNSWRV